MLGLRRAQNKSQESVLPRSTEDASAIMKVCCSRRIPVTSFAGGTSLPGAIVSTRGGVCVDFQNMASIICIHKEDMDAVVQPGMKWRELNVRLEKDGLFYPPDPSPEACLGGMVSRANEQQDASELLMFTRDRNELCQYQHVSIWDHEGMGHFSHRGPC